MTLELAALASGDWMERTFAYAVRTLADDDPGAATVMAKMSELLFDEAVRRYLAALPHEEIGWLAGLRDPGIGRALFLMHAQLDEDWTADALAREVNRSRSAFHCAHWCAADALPAQLADAGCDAEAAQKAPNDSRNRLRGRLPIRGRVHARIPATWRKRNAPE